MMANRIVKIPAAASRAHFREDDDSLLFEPERILGKSLEMPTTHQPRISVVTAVDMAWTAYGFLISCSNSVAPSVPRRYPRMLAMMIIAAVNSMLRFFLKQTSSTIAIVSIVRSSSSSIPANLQQRATTACRMAKVWMMNDGFIFENTDIFLFFGLRR